MERRNRKGLRGIRNKGMVVGALAATLMGTACDPLFDSQHCRQVPSESRSRRILAVGDSITAFWSEHHTNSCQAYSDYASKEINEHIDNVAIGGTELSGPNGKCIPKQYEDAAAVNGPYDIVILTAGGNDLKRECPLAGNESCTVKCRDKLLELADEMETLVTDIVRDGSEVVIVGYYSMRNKEYAKYNECLRTLMSKYESLATASPHVSFVNTSDLVDPDDATNYLIDGVHPSIQVTRKIGKKVADAIMGK